MKARTPVRLVSVSIAAMITVAVLAGCQPYNKEGVSNQGKEPESSVSDSSINTPDPSQELPSEFDNSELSITPTEELNRTGTPPDEIDIKEYRLIVDGLVETPLALSYDQILSYPTVTKVVLLICPGVFTDNAEWTGVPVKTILAEAGISSDATSVTFHDFDYYAKTLPLEVAQQDGVFLAHTVNGEVLPVEHGYPLRLVVEGRYGSEWVKWVQRIEVQ
jgi:DMSO/TMAO reductase YedYZ molybdopterin-dependent catalytic subunit